MVLVRCPSSMTEPQVTLTMLELQTPRLLLRAWRDDDLPAYIDLSADPQVMRYFPAPQSPERTTESFLRIREHVAEHGFGLWALERRDSGEFIGFTGLGHVGFEAHFTPAIEIGWRLARAHWGQGFASEAARAALGAGFGPLGLEEIIAFTVVDNVPSRRVMEAVGMHHDPREDFDHPNLSPGHPLRRHVLYRLRREEWNAARG